MKKKYFSLLLTFLPCVLIAQQKPDTLTLKNGRVIAGYVYKMENGKIYIAKPTDSLVFNTDEVQGIIFMHPVKGYGSSKSPTAFSESKSTFSESKSTSGSSGTSKSYSYTSKSNSSNSGGSFSSFDENEYPDSAFYKTGDNGLVIFTCNTCNSDGNLFIRSDIDEGKSSAFYAFTMEKEKHYFMYAIKLLPGVYNWKYSDLRHDQIKKGKFEIKKGEEKKILLFGND